MNNNYYEEYELMLGISTLKKIYFEKIIDPYKKSEKIVDLHAHTNYSDGELSPYDLIKLAIEKRISTIAITDHNTIEGVKNLNKNDPLITDSGIKIINGIELSAQMTKGKMHILGYDIDINNKDLNDNLKNLKTISLNSVLSIIEQIKRDYGITFSYDDLVELINSNHNLGRPDIAKLCVKNGYSNTIDEAFIKYLNDAYKKTIELNNKPTFEKCINLIKNSNGLSVLAHPNSLKLDEKEFLIMLKKLIDAGLNGIEVYHSSHSKKDIEYYLEIAKKYNLLVSGGSDFHGKNVKPEIELGTGKKNNLKIKKLSILSQIK